MKRRIFCALFALLLAAMPALAEGGLVSALETAAPEATNFSGEGVSLTLPVGLIPLDEEELEAYDAAVQADYPDVARTLFAAADEEHSAFVLLAAMDSDMDCLDAAREAAQAVIGDADKASEQSFGENRCAAFACAIGEQGFRLYYFSDGERLLILGASGLELDAIEEMLTGLAF